MVPASAIQWRKKKEEMVQTTTIVTIWGEFGGKISCKMADAIAWMFKNPI